ncbi:MAG: bifunctional methylenetetrahydrofolate dehydrogenase/methenyltetrahydrofolate cyclohydrolase FolD [Kiritimatiellae bacterium]|nr:bifunctional methylenetetrahydrofolate dehydrogenase/methenyltetrahydrofolate cyclohydrolase FolD [Kiritimatiellia bacterium]
MGAVILDGKKLAAEMRADIAAKVAELKRDFGITPGLGVILVGANPASISYVTAKEKACTEAGMYSEDIRLPEEATQDDVVAIVRRMNLDPKIHGILVQLPLPKGIDESAVISAISPEKDVDGFTPENVGRMVIGEQSFLPCTPHGVIKLLERAGVETSGRHVVVVGRSNIVGKPVAQLLMRKAPGCNATVTVCHTATPDLSVFTRQADILVVAAGHPNTVTADMVKPGVAVIDVGVNRIPDPTRSRGYRLSGDVDFDAVSKIASVITPVPGGVGPMTITMLLYNTLASAQRSK